MQWLPFSELIRNFDKIRDFIRDFYIHGFKKRRIESYLGPYVKWNYDAEGKHTFVSLSTAHKSRAIPCTRLGNPKPRQG